MNSRHQRKTNDEERIRDLVQITADNESDEESIFKSRRTRQGRLFIKPKKDDDDEKYINELKDLGMYEDGMSIDQVRAILSVIAESKETAETEESLRSKNEEWEDVTVLERTESEKEDKNPATTSASSHAAAAAEEGSQELFVDDRKSPLQNGAGNSSTNAFIPSDDDETLLCSPVRETASPSNGMLIDSDHDSPILKSGPVSPEVPSVGDRPTCPVYQEFVQATSDSGDSEPHGEQLKTVATVTTVRRRYTKLSPSTADAASDSAPPVRVVSPEPSSETSDSELKQESNVSWNAKTLQKRAKKLSNRPKHKVPYYRVTDDKDKIDQNYTNVIVNAFNEYFNLFAEFQKTSAVPVKSNWGKPVQAGSHQEGTLDLKPPRGKAFSFTKYMRIFTSENSQSQTDTESDGDFTSKKDVSVVASTRNLKRRLGSPDPYEFSVAEDDNIVIESSPPPLSATAACNDSGWLTATTYKRQLKLDGKTKPNKSDKVLPSNTQLANNKLNLKENVAKKRKLMVKAPPSYDTSDRMLEVITVPDEKLFNNSSDLKLKDGPARRKASNTTLRSSKRNSAREKINFSELSEDTDDGSKDGSTEEANEKLVECPVCQRTYNETQIGYHASKCEGKEKESKNSSTVKKNSCCCYVCKGWYPLIKYQSHVAECVKKHSSSPLTTNEIELLGGEKSSTVVDRPTGSRLLDQLAYHDETSESLDAVETFRPANRRPTVNNSSSLS